LKKEAERGGFYFSSKDLYECLGLLFEDGGVCMSEDNAKEGR